MSDLVVYDGMQIPAPMVNGKQYVAMKPLVEGMGFDWESQRQIIQRDEVLSEGACVIQVPSALGA